MKKKNSPMDPHQKNQLCQFHVWMPSTKPEIHRSFMPARRKNTASRRMGGEVRGRMKSQLAPREEKGTSWGGDRDNGPCGFKTPLVG